MIAISIAAAFALFCYTANLVLLAFAGVLGAVLADGSAGWVSRRTHLSHRWSYIVVLGGAAATVGLLSWLLVPRVIVQVSELAQTLPKAIQNAREYLGRFEWGRIVTSHLANAGFSSIPARVEMVGAVLVRIGIAVTVMVVLTAYIGEEPGYYERGLLSLLPPARRGRIDSLLQHLGSTLRWWVIGQSIPMAALGTVTLIGLLFLKIPLAFTLSLFTGVMIFIPFVGALIAYFATALVTLSTDPSKLLVVTILFLGIHVLEGYVLTPLVQRHAVYLPPAITIISQVLMSTLFGFLGLILATPLAAAIRVIVKELYVDRMSDA